MLEINNNDNINHKSWNFEDALQSTISLYSDDNLSLDDIKLYIDSCIFITKK
jgi:hypothetical protein